MPSEILGKWHTSSAPRYYNFTIEITKDHIVFHNGPNIRDVHSISRITSVQEDGKRLHKLYFKNSKGEKSHLFLYFLKEQEEPVLRFKNQENIKWTRVPE